MTSPFPTAIPLSDWGRPALLRTSSSESPVTVIPQTIRIDQFDLLAHLQDDTRSFLLAESDLPANHSWSDCQLIVNSLPHRIVTAHGSGTSGWVLVETRLMTPLPAA